MTRKDPESLDLEKLIDNENELAFPNACLDLLVTDPEKNKRLKQALLEQQKKRRAALATSPVQLWDVPESHFNEKSENKIQPGSICGPFRIEKKIGEGGSGHVYLAQRHDDLKMTVAIKTLDVWHGKILNHLDKECKILAGLKHPNIAHLIDVGALPNGQPWIAMEYVDGPTLGEYLTQSNLSTKQKIQLFLKICSALTYAHRQMVIHRDLKPSNIMVDSNGEPKLLDFGIAGTLNPDTGEQMTMTSRHSMTPEYASPEQASGLRLTAASDVYSLGIVLYEMLAGRRPYSFNSRSIGAIASQIKSASITRPSVICREKMGVKPAKIMKGDLDTIILKALEYEPDRRYQSVEALATDLVLYLEGRPIEAQPPTATYLFRKFIARHPWPMGAASILLLLLISFFFYANHQHALVKKERDYAQTEQRRAQATSDFLISMFQNVDPNLSKQGDVSAFDVMETGRREMEISLQKEPEVRARLLPTMSNVYRSLGKYETALELLKKAEALNTNTFELEREYIQTLEEQGHYEAAIIRLNEGFLSQATRDPHQEAFANRYRARLLFKMGRYREAIEAFETALERAPQKTGNTYYELLKDRAPLLFALSQHKEAIEDLKLVVAWQRETLGDIHSHLADSLILLASNEEEVMDFDSANVHLEESKNIYTQLYGKDSFMLDTITLSQARLKGIQGETAQEESMLLEALAKRKERLGSKHPMVAEVLMLLGRHFYRLNQFQDALKLQTEALAINMNAFGKEHPKVANSFLELGMIYTRLGEIENAAIQYRSALLIRRKIFGDNHVEVAHIHVMLSRSLMKNGEFESALKLLEQALETALNVYGKFHYKTGYCINEIGILHARLKQYDTALGYYTESNNISKVVFGEGHPWNFLGRRNEVECLMNMGLYEDARILQGKIIEDRNVNNSARQEENDPRQIEDYINLGKILTVDGDYDSALEQFNRAEALAQINYKEFDSKRLMPTYYKAEALLVMGRENEAAFLFEEILDLHGSQKATFVKQAHAYLAEIGSNQGCFEKASEHIERALALESERSDRDTWRIHTYKSIQGYILTNLERSTVGEQLLRDSYQELKESDAPEREKRLAQVRMGHR